jgi:hypothetical protein
MVSRRKVAVIFSRGGAGSIDTDVDTSTHMINNAETSTRADPSFPMNIDSQCVLVCGFSETGSAGGVPATALYTTWLGTRLWGAAELVPFTGLSGGGSWREQPLNLKKRRANVAAGQTTIALSRRTAELFWWSGGSCPGCRKETRVFFLPSLLLLLHPLSRTWLS